MPVIARDLKDEDIDKIIEIHNKDPYTNVPGLNYMIINAVIENTDSGKIIGYGAVKIFVEAQLILDRELSKRDRAEALMEAMHTAIIYSRDAGVETLYANCIDENFAKCLENRFKFKRVPGTLLSLELNAAFEDK